MRLTSNGNVRFHFEDNRIRYSASASHCIVKITAIGELRFLLLTNYKFKRKKNYSYTCQTLFTNN